METSQSIVVGVISGLLTSAIVYLFIGIFHKIIKPWYQDIIYKGIRIDGEWTLQRKFENSNILQDELMELKQHANAVTGTRTIIKRFPNNDVSELKIFKIKGKIIDRFVSISSENINNRKIGISSGLFEVCKGGDALIGSENWFDVGADKVLSDYVVITRKD
jgi:hypothetical protein